MYSPGSFSSVIYKKGTLEYGWRGRGIFELHESVFFLQHFPYFKFFLSWIYIFCCFGPFPLLITFLILRLAYREQDHRNKPLSSALESLSCQLSCRPGWVQTVQTACVLVGRQASDCMILRQSDKEINNIVKQQKQQQTDNNKNIHFGKFARYIRCGRNLFQRFNWEKY